RDPEKFRAFKPLNRSRRRESALILCLESTSAPTHVGGYEVHGMERAASALFYFGGARLLASRDRIDQSWIFRLAGTLARPVLVKVACYRNTRGLDCGSGNLLAGRLRLRDRATAGDGFVEGHRQGYRSFGGGRDEGGGRPGAGADRLVERGEKPASVRSTAGVGPQGIGRNQSEPGPG